MSTVERYAATVALAVAVFVYVIDGIISRLFFSANASAFLNTRFTTTGFIADKRPLAEGVGMFAFSVKAAQSATVAHVISVCVDMPEGFAHLSRLSSAANATTNLDFTFGASRFAISSPLAVNVFVQGHYDKGRERINCERQFAVRYGGYDLFRRTVVDMKDNALVQRKCKSIRHRDADGHGFTESYGLAVIRYGNVRG